MSYLYDEYLHDHIHYVQRAYDWLIDREIIDGSDDMSFLAKHDASKYSEDEYKAYDDYFYGTRSAKVVENFNYAWLHHIHHNPHHWQYWVLQHDDEPEEALEMPRKYVIEMICDWWSFSFKEKQLNKIFLWYEEHKNMKLHPKTRKLVESILSAIKYELEEEDTIRHYGIMGQKWGVRRFQNKDGSLTEEGRSRYNSGKKTVFVSGSSKTQDSESAYYRKELPKEIQKKLNNYMEERANIVVGDAPGIDRQVQDYLKSNDYSDVVVYGPGKEVRYLADSKWQTRPIDAPEYEVGSKEWLAKKDIEMEKVATEGLAVILDEGAKATRKNVDRLIEHNKHVSVYELSKYGDSDDKWR